MAEHPPEEHVALAESAHAAPHDEHAHGDPREHLAHHFDTAKQQYEAGKLGLWIFLLTEILFFSGLFCAYAVFRRYHPEIFLAGHKSLNVTLGAINTSVLLFSSLTMAWAVRCAQLSQKRGLIICLTLTLLCAGGFLGIKYVEYAEKFHHGLLPGRYFKPHEEGEPDRAESPKKIMPGGNPDPQDAPAATPQSAPQLPHGVETASNPATHGAGAVDALDQVSADDKHAHTPGETVENLRIFFGIYFVMTGIHAIHVIGGIAAISWLLVGAIRGRFSRYYFGPVDCVGLYWHLVDLIWIYLFPLLYLIH